MPATSGARAFHERRCVCLEWRCACLEWRCACLELRCACLKSSESLALEYAHWLTVLARCGARDKNIKTHAGWVHFLVYCRFKYVVLVYCKWFFFSVTIFFKLAPSVMSAFCLHFVFATSCPRFVFDSLSLFACLRAARTASPACGAHRQPCVRRARLLS